MEKFFIGKGENVIFNNIECIIIKVIDINIVSVEELNTNIIHTVNVKELSKKKSEVNNHRDIVSLNENDFNKAKKRFDIIKPILDNRRDSSLLKNVSEQNNVSVATLYRWLKLFDDNGTVSSLIGRKKSGGKGKSRLLDIQEEVIQNKIHEIFLNNSKKSIEKTIREIQLECNRLEISSPHPNTVRNRIKNLSKEEVLRKRIGAKEAKYKYEPLKGSFFEDEYPLSVVQIDHTKVDIVLVDEEDRKPLQRPWLTLAMDVYSRMVVGIYLSFETPGAIGTGMCIANSILPKDIWLSEFGINADWPCWGVMDSIHMDNAKEFRGNMLKKAALNYGIDLNFRPVATPHFGGHIERLLGTFSKEIHDLPGTTFSNSQDRKNYNSNKNASFTLSEFEKWLIIYITKIYHTKIHSGINTSPLEKYKKGIYGDKNSIGRGIPPRILNERRVRIDFMPIVKRTIQEYGVLIDHIHYYSDVLRNYIHDENMKGDKIQHIFRRDPRDISIIYFFDPNQNEYYEIPYRNASLPSLSVWEYRKIVKKLKDNKIIVNEEKIFEAYRELNEIEKRALRETKIQNSNSYSKKTLNVNEKKSIKVVKEVKIFDMEIEPFEDIDDGTLDK